jgi:hypothetical protein
MSMPYVHRRRTSELYEASNHPRAFADMGSI